MATKKQKREAGERKAKQDAEERRQSGLAAQKADRESRSQRMDAWGMVQEKMNSKARSTLLRNGVNPSTGHPFTDSEMAEMEKKANTPERRHLLQQIRAGRAGLLNEEPPLNMSDYTDVGIPAEMTVGEFRDRMDQAWTDWTAKSREADLGSKFMKAARSADELVSTLSSQFESATKDANRLHEALAKDFEQKNELDKRVIGELAPGDATSDYTKRDERFPARFMETQSALRKFTGFGDQ